MTSRRTDPPRRALLFSGHMVDSADRKSPRFPQSVVHLAARAIEATLDELKVGVGDRAVSSAASGGDLLFASACLERGVSLDIFLPFAPLRFVETSVRPGGPDWVQRFETLHADQRVHLHAGDDPNKDGEAYARCNAQMLEFATELGAEALDFICLWDGGRGDGPGGTEHMVQAVKQRGGRVHWIDTRTLR
ncbi:MAG: hypothetical protein ACREBN_04235 [Burkholderiaceae bacterium]